MTTTRENSSFGRGGCYTCGDCGKRTRATFDPHAAELELCQDCYDDAGDENTHNDYHHGNPDEGCRFCQEEAKEEAGQADEVASQADEVKVDEIKVGDAVRSFDFARGPLGRDLDGPHACYLEGVVVGITDPQAHEVFLDCARLEIRVTRRVWEGVADDEEGKVGGLIYPPQNGTPTNLGRVTNGVERLEKGGPR